MSTLTLKFHGLQDRIINTMVETGIAQTKSEAVRMAVLKFGFDAGLLDGARVLSALRESFALEPLTEEEIMEGIAEARE